MMQASASDAKSVPERIRRPLVNVYVETAEKGENISN